MALWIPITLAGAFLQNLRSVAQKHLKSAMGTTGATFVRFGFGLPVAILFLVLLRWRAEAPVPDLQPAFYGWVTLGGLAQIAGTFALIHVFSFRNFAVGTAWSRTEPAQAALFGLLFLGDRVSAGGLAAILISVLGVMLISVAHVQAGWRATLTSVFQRNALIGLGSGMMFGVSAVSYRAASTSVGGPDFLTQAAVTLVATLCLQVLVMGAWMLWRERGEFARIARAWKVSLFAGVCGASASFCWFAAMTLQSAAMVKALGQVEMLFTFAATVFFFREKITWREALGCLLITAGILVLLFFG
ncbi:EamA family transporter [Xinfangfangia sp. D13-10-4-6]|uniref:DMT family transporter n=1 Tax=Pseudogemmobacter hezensis TaxID=2737662 RepID=UPI001551AB07|nr:DMT family transporter [Pseudogemmobacter hezensis]NPD13910.1 EamA family transporter [Pseudogemmobacter hezensis]